MQTNAPRWDLSDLFSSIDDPEVKKTIANYTNKAKDFRSKYLGHIDEFAEPQKLLEVIKEYESILVNISTVEAYAELVFSTNTASTEIGAFLQKVRTATVEAYAELIFFELEILQLSEDDFNKILNSEELKEYKHYFKKLHSWKEHRLSEKEEKILEYKNLTGKLAISRFFEQELSKQKFLLDLNGEQKILNESEILNLLHTTDKQSDREKVAKSFTKGLLEKESVFTFAFNTLVDDKKNDDKLLNFTYPEQARHLTNEANADSVEAMVKVVEESYDLVQDYYRFKKEVLKLDNIYDYDRYASFSFENETYDYSSAKDIVLKSFNSFAEYFGKTAAKFFENNWIDAAMADAKRGGAYCMRISPYKHPYVFLNYAGSINDVMTLAHELGHGINFELSRIQVPLNYSSPLTLSETASIFAESLVFSELTKQEHDKKVLLGLYMKRIEGIIASVHRQVSMYRFEHDLHSTYRLNGELSTQEINALWRKRQEQMFGDSLVLSSDYDNWWMYIQHFTDTPFYVYAYAFGELFAFGLLDRYKKQGENFLQQYKQFLETANSKSPDEIGKIFDVDFNDAEFWRGGIRILEQYIEKAKQIYKEL